MNLIDIQMKSAETLARVLSFGSIPNRPEDLNESLETENIDKAVEIFDKRKYTRPLTLALIIEGLQHKSFKLLNYRVDANPYKEIEYVIDYVKKRVKWLETKYPAQLYRIKTFIELLQKNNWDLKSPIIVHLSNGQRMTIEVLDEDKSQ